MNAANEKPTRNEFRIESAEDIRIWNVERLWEESKHLPVTMVPLEDFAFLFDADRSGTGAMTYRQIVEGMRAVQRVDLSYPIITADHECVMDGNARLCKALFEGRTEVPVVHFENLPTPHQTIKKNKL